MSYFSTMTYLPRDTRLAPDSLEFVPELGDVATPGDWPVQMTMDQVFELAWRLKALRLQAQVDFTIGVDIVGSISVDGIVSKVLTSDATEITQHASGVFNPDWPLVQGTSVLTESGMDPVEGNEAYMALGFLPALEFMRRVPGSLSPRQNVWLPFLTCDVTLGGAVPTHITSGGDGSAANFVGLMRYEGVGLQFDIPMYLRNRYVGSWEVSAFSAVATPVEFWEYAARPGYPIYNANTGARLLSPFAVQR